MWCQKACPFHQNLADFLQREETELWDWVASDKFTASAYDEQRLYLLKNTYRLEHEKHADLYKAAENITAKLNLDIPITLYQLMDNQQRNAGLVFQPDCIQILFSGDMLTSLPESEMKFTLGHEMAHFIHQVRDGGRFQVADRLLDWICGEAGAAASYGKSFRLTRLYQEIFSDRIGLYCSDDLDASISTLVRISSGLSDVSAKAYLEQADEVLKSQDKMGSEGYSHPETFIRARALADWSADQESADEKLIEIVEGALELEHLDLIGQAKLSGLTRQFIERFLDRPWQDTETLEAHAQGFFYEYRHNAVKAAGDDGLGTLKTAIAPLAESLKDYLCFILLDFATVDSNLEDAPLIQAAKYAKDLGLDRQFDVLAGKELKLTKKQVAALHKASAQEETA